MHQLHVHYVGGKVTGVLVGERCPHKYLLGGAALHFTVSIERWHCDRKAFPNHY